MKLYTAMLLINFVSLKEICGIIILGRGGGVKGQVIKEKYVFL